MKPRRVLRYCLAAFYAAAGVAHLVAPEPFLRIMPDWVPAKAFVVTATGVFEIAAAVGLLFAQTRRMAGLGLALYAVCVFPANVKHALEAVEIAGMPTSWWYHGPRLALQPVLVWLALVASRD
jgi:uncharacterized membrane protein